MSENLSGLQHGTVTAVIDGVSYEVTTLVGDNNASHHLSGDCSGTFEDLWRFDAEHRDLTINAMSMDLDGLIHDYFDGQQHIKDERSRRFSC